MPGRSWRSTSASTPTQECRRSFHTETVDAGAATRRLRRPGRRSRRGVRGPVEDRHAAGRGRSGTCPPRPRPTDRRTCSTYRPAMLVRLPGTAPRPRTRCRYAPLTREATAERDAERLAGDAHPELAASCRERLAVPPREGGQARAGCVLPASEAGERRVDRGELVRGQLEAVERGDVRLELRRRCSRRRASTSRARSRSVHASASCASDCPRALGDLVQRAQPVAQVAR